MHQINPADAQRVDARSLYAPLRKPDEWPARRATFASCSGRCSQGRRLCITPEACRLADDDEDAGKHMPGAGALVVPIVVGVALVAVLLAAHFWPR